MEPPIKLDKIRISFDETHHIYDNKPLYQNRFKKVMSFHPPGLAPAMDDTGAFHIDLKGEAIYQARFLKTYGFYCGLAAVETQDGWCHINPNGEFAYHHFFAWVGNFQEDLCVVRTFDGKYYHILPNGTPLYEERYEYAGDFRHGIAVVKKKDGFAYHIDNKGHILYQSSYTELDVFHKGFARAKDQFGWCHINKKGEPAYHERFLSIEPFYNGNALVKKFTGELGIIDEKGRWIKSLTEEKNPPLEVRNYYQDLMVSYWKTQTIYAAIKLNILDELATHPCDLQTLATRLHLDSAALSRLMNGLQVLGLIVKDDEKYIVTDNGKLFTEQHPSTLKFACLIWGDEHYLTWHDLSHAIQTGGAMFESIYGKNFFQWLNDNPSKLKIYHKAISTYAHQDYARIPTIHDFSHHKRLLDLGGGIGILLANILLQYPQLEGFLLEQELVLQAAAEFLENKGVRSRCTLISGNFFEKLPLQCDAILMSRILHDWNDTSCLKILQNCFDALDTNGKLYIIEIIYPDKITIDKGVLLDLNMLVVTGGKERTKREFQELLKKANFTIEEIKPINSILSLIIATKAQR